MQGGQRGIHNSVPIKKPREPVDSTNDYIVHVTELPQAFLVIGKLN